MHLPLKEVRLRRRRRNCEMRSANKTQRSMEGQKREITGRTSQLQTFSGQKVFFFAFRTGAVIANWSLSIKQMSRLMRSHGVLMSDHLRCEWLTHLAGCTTLPSSSVWTWGTPEGCSCRLSNSSLAGTPARRPVKHETNRSESVLFWHEHP